MATEEFYSKAGWELVRELLLLRDSGEHRCQELFTSRELECILSEVPPAEPDERFRGLAVRVSEFFRTSEWKTQALEGTALQVHRAHDVLRYRGAVAEIQSDFHCSRLVAECYQRGFEYGAVSLGGLSLLRGILGLPSCKAHQALVAQRISVEKLASILTSLEDPAGEPSPSCLMARAAFLADSLGHQSTDTDHLLLTLLQDQRTTASRLLAQIEVCPHKVRSSLGFGNSEPCSGDWSPDVEWPGGHITYSWPLAPENLSSLAQRDEEREGWTLVITLQTLGLGDAPLLAAILRDDPRDGFWDSTSLRGNFEVRFLELAFYVKDSEAISGALTELADRLIRDWSASLPSDVFAPSLMMVLDEGASSLMLRKILSMPGCQGAQAIGFAGQALAELDALPHSSTLESEELWALDTNTAIRHVAQFLRRENPQTLPGTLHLLIALLEFAPRCDASQILTKLGVTSEGLQSFPAAAAKQS